MNGYVRTYIHYVFLANRNCGDGDLCPSDNQHRGVRVVFTSHNKQPRTILMGHNDVHKYELSRGVVTNTSY